MAQFNLMIFRDPYFCSIWLRRSLAYMDMDWFQMDHGDD